MIRLAPLYDEWISELSRYACDQNTALPILILLSHWLIESFSKAQLPYDITTACCKGIVFDQGIKDGPGLSATFVLELYLVTLVSGVEVHFSSRSPRPISQYPLQTIRYLLFLHAMPEGSTHVL